MKFKGTIIITDPCYILKDSSNDWRKCNCGENMEALGLSHYICEDTIYGDWSCTAYKIEGNPYKIIEDLVKDSKAGCKISCSRLGDFCADAGMVAVFDLDEVRKYNPGIDKWIASHDWCVTTISNFDGDVEYYIDKEGYAHIAGIGNLNFFTIQTGL